MIADPALRTVVEAFLGLLFLLAILRMRVLDRYVGAVWIMSFLLSAVTMCGLYVVVDLAEKADALLKTNTSSHLQLIIDFYSCRIPLFASRLFPMMCLAATIMTVVRLTKSNELVPMILAGRSVFRILSPAFLAMGVVMACSLAVDEWVLPRLALQIQTTDSSVGKEKTQDHVHVFDRDGRTLWFYNKYNLRTQAMWDVMVERKGETGGTWRIRAQTARWVAAPRSGWLMSSGVEWTLDARGGIEGSARAFGEDGLLVPSNFSPDLVETADNMFVPIQELARQALAHPDDPTPLVQFHTRLVFPLFNVILPALGLAVMLRREVRSLMLGFGICLVVGLVFFAVYLFFVNLGSKGGLDPVVAAWTPVVLFVAVDLWFLGSVRT